MQDVFAKIKEFYEGVFAIVEDIIAAIKKIVADASSED